MYPQEVKDGVNACNVSFVRDAQMAAFALLESVTGRRLPALVSLQWKDVHFVMQAAQLPTGEVIQVPGVVLNLQAEKVVDLHNSRLVILDSTADDQVVNEAHLHPPLNLLNLALAYGVVSQEAFANCKVGDEIPKVAGTGSW